MSWTYRVIERPTREWPQRAVVVFQDPQHGAGHAAFRDTARACEFLVTAQSPELLEAARRYLEHVRAELLSPWEAVFARVSA